MGASILFWTLFTLVAVALFIASIVFICVALCYHFDHKNDVRLSMKDFYKFYQIAPTNWNFDDDFVWYYKEHNGYGYSENIFFTNYIDVLRYKIFKHRIEKENNEKMLNRDTIEFLKVMREDVNEAMRKN